MIETQNLEFKRQWNDDVLKTVVAFLNSDEGGVIQIGINNDQTVHGVHDIDYEQLKIANQISDSISPECISHINLIPELKSDPYVIKISVEKGLLKPYFLIKQGMTSRGCFIRVGSSTRQMPQEKIDNLYSKRVRNSIREIKCGESILRFEQLKIYYNEKGKTLNEQFESILNFRTSNSDFNILAYLMADDNSNPIVFAKYSGKSRVELLERSDFGKQSLIKSTKLILEKLEIENKLFSTIKSIERENIYLWNPIAIREAVINAIVHNDYTKSASPKVEIFDDRIEITSGGGLPQGINQIEIFQGHSVPRNPEIVRIFSDLALVEQLGSGISRILEFYPKECIEISENFIRVTFPKSVKDTKHFSFAVRHDALLKHIQSMLDGDRYETIKPTEAQFSRFLELAKLLSLDQIKILRFSVSPKSNRELQEDCLQLKKHSDNYKKVIEPLIKEGLLSRTIPGVPSSPNQKYFISEKGKIFLYIIEYLSSNSPNLKDVDQASN